MYALRAVAVFLMLGAGAFAQSDSHPTFEVASIKPNNSGSNAIGNFIVCSNGGRVSAKNILLDMLIQQAYGIKDFQLLGRTNWVSTQRFDIEARPGSPVGRDACLMMLQSLLAERLKLTIHRETKQLPIYKLIVGKNGPKLHKVAASAPTGAKIFDTNRGQLITYGVSMAQFAGMLAMTGELENLAVDDTGLDGNYEFTLEWSPASTARPDAPAGPSLFTALQEQLGLKLEATKGPVDVIVIDHVEKPSEN